jgi:hypothetical protein
MIHLKEQKRHLAQCLESISVVHFSVQILGQFEMQINRLPSIIYSLGQFISHVSI